MSFDEWWKDNAARLLCDMGDCSTMMLKIIAKEAWNAQEELKKPKEIYVVINTGGFVMRAFTVKKDCIDCIEKMSKTLKAIVDVETIVNIDEDPIHGRKENRKQVHTSEKFLKDYYRDN